MAEFTSIIHKPNRNFKNLSLSTTTKKGSRRHWAVVLDNIKSLYCQRQFKQCLSQCTQFLEDSSAPGPTIYKVFLLFYTALAHESIARNLSALSMQKERNLESAIAFYRSALSHLHQSNHSQNFSSSTDTSETPTTLASPDSSYKAISPSSSISSLYSAAGSIDRTASKPCDSDTMKPSPLRIRKTVRFVEQPADQRIDTGSILDANAANTATDTWLYIRALSRYNANVAELSVQLENHIKSVGILIEEAKEDKKSRAIGSGKRLAEFQGLGFEEVEIKETLRRERIVQGRRTNWQRRRFEPQRYQDLCQKVLEEL